jgi:hypothetical protein
MIAYPLASPAKVQEALDVLGTGRLTSRKVPLLTQLVIATANGVPQPPSLAPVLMAFASAELGTYIANLDWTASNRTGSAGFAYQIWVSLDGGSYSLLDSVGPSTLSYVHDASPTGGTYSYYIKPINDVGEGPSSNAASVVLPGESEAPVLTGPSEVSSEDPTALLEWNAIPGATLYSVQRSPDNATWTQIYTPTGTSQSVTLSFSPSYYRVIPFAGVFEGLPSNSISITIVIPPAPESYLRPDGISTYLRPDGTSIYLRP